MPFSRVRVRVRIRIRFSVWLVSGSAHVFILLSAIIVTLSTSAEHGIMRPKDAMAYRLKSSQWS